MKAVILCGGKGSRLKPLTETVPKPLIKLMNRPVIDIIIEKLINSGFDDISLSLGYKADDIIEYCESRNYPANINYFVEPKPLGTAGGVKYCVSSSEEDILVLSGDNIFDFDLKEVLEFHSNTDADITVCSVRTEDPREYGVIITDDDGSINSFVEKPTWEYVGSLNINTGIYLLKGKIIDMIPRDTFYDFSDDLFHRIFEEDLRFMCCHMDGFWGDIGEFEFMFAVQRTLFLSESHGISFKGVFYGKDTLLANGAVIKAPSLIGKKTDIGAEAVIGPFSVMGENCTVGTGANIEECIIGDSCCIGNDTEIHLSVISDFTKIEDNCFVDRYSVIGQSSHISRFTRIMEHVRIWPASSINAGELVSGDILYGQRKGNEFNVFGLSGKVNSGLNIIDLLELGIAIGSLASVSKIGIGSDGKNTSDNYKNSCIAGIRSTGSICYDFGEMFKSQAYFYSAYCSLDGFIYISLDEENLNVSFFGKFGMPFPSKVSRQIGNNLKFKSYCFCPSAELSDFYNMKLFNVVYKSFFKKILETASVDCKIFAESENRILCNFVNEILSECSDKKSSHQLTVLFNATGTEMFVIENGKYYSSDRILALLCELELAQGKSIIVPEDSADFLEVEAREFSGELYRVYENNYEESSFENSDILQSVWTFDCILMLAKLLNVLSVTKLSVKDLFESQRGFEISKKTVEIDAVCGSLKNLIIGAGAKKNSDDLYYTLEHRNGKVRLRQLGNTNQIRILARSFDTETAKELAGMVVKKLKDTNIDKDD